MSTIWYRTPGGAVVEQTGTPDPCVPGDCVALSLSEYQNWMKAAEQAAKDQAAAEAAAAQKRQRVAQNAPTLLVAAASAPTDVKLVAAYVCDGVDDHVQINEALRATATLGSGTVVLTSGAFYLGDSIKVPASSGVTLAGDGAGTSLWNLNADRYAITFSGVVTGAVLRDFTLNCDGPAMGGKAGLTAGGILADGAVRCDFNGISLDGCDGYGIHMGSSGSARNNRVTGCRFERHGKDGVNVSGSGHRIIDNSFGSVGENGDPGDAAGIHLAEKATGCIVSGNTLMTAETDGSAGSLVRESDGSQGNLISGNVFVEIGTAANGLLYQSNPGSTRVSGNVGVPDSL